MKKGRAQSISVASSNDAAVEATSGRKLNADCPFQNPDRGSYRP